MGTVEPAQASGQPSEPASGPKRPGRPDRTERAGFGRRALFAGGAGAALATTMPVPARAAAMVVEGPLSLRDPRVGCLLDGGDEAAKLTAAFALLPSGGELYLPPGVLGLGAEVTLPANVSLTGANLGASVVRPAAGYTGRLVGTGGWNRISHLKFDGRLSSGVLLTIRRPRSMFSQLHLTSSGSHAIEFVGTAENSSAHANKLTDINIDDCLGTGIVIGPYGYDNEFLNTWIGECQVGMRISTGACLFENLHVWGCRGNGVELRRGADSTVFQNVYLESNGTGGTGSGINAWQVTGTQVVGGRLWRNATNGASFDACPRTRVMGLDVHENGDAGVRGHDSAYCQVVGNQFYDLGTPKRQGRPVITSGTSDRWLISDNVMLAADHLRGGKLLVGADNLIGGNLE
ncbi:right-handed parallel beta-helix repeat-containing protein [Plantactinospora sp. WMMB782]|uniref:right-handed parallel beta-helix repeat-containing protein n=1 Tax=Plantactinospora sp. WMMB782 TaxID=3404121 RepID=UPI003B967081